MNADSGRGPKPSEQSLHDLARMLLFDLAKDGARYRLSRDADVSEPVRHENLTRGEVIEILNTWKLRGPHGG